MLDIIILAAGKGTRMRSNTPKVLHTLAGKPFVQHVIDTAKALDASTINLVVGHEAQMVETALAHEQLRFVEQKQQLGTGHAVLQAKDLLDDDSISLILYGDVPLTRASTLQALLGQVSDTSMGLLTVKLDNPTGYGRIVRDGDNQITSIVEQKDASADQLAINEVNTGVMALKSKYLKQWLPLLTNDNAQNEYYLTDTIALAKSNHIKIVSAHPQSEIETVGVNSRQQQAQLERDYQRFLANQLMDKGTTLLDPARFDCRGNLTVGADGIIDINCVFEGEVKIGENVSIGANCVVKNTQIGDNTVIHPNSVIEDSVIGQHCQIGPYARIRPGSHFADNVKIGNFVETKKVHIGAYSKVNHLSYVGDASLGEHVNVGAGAITCNYDGANKHQTHIGNHVFVGSNAAMVAPVALADGVTVGAGTTVTADGGKDELIVARPKQRNIKGWKRPIKTS